MHRIGVPHSSEVSGAPEENKWVIFFPPLGALGVICVTILNIRPSDSKFTSLDLAHYCRRAIVSGSGESSEGHLKTRRRSHALYGLVLIFQVKSLVMFCMMSDNSRLFHVSLLYYDVYYPWHNNCRATPSRAWWSLHWRCWCRWPGAPGWAPSPPGLSWWLSSCCADTGLMLWCWDQYPESDDAGRWASWDHLVLVSTWCWSLDVSRVMRWRDTETETVCGVGAGGGLAIHSRRVPCVPRPPPIILHTDPGADHTQCVPDFHDTLGNHLTTSLHKECQWKKNATLTFSMDLTTKWSLNDGKISPNFCEWGLF